MGDRKIKVTIDRLGNPTIEAEGFIGIGCKEATASLEGKFQGRDAQLDVIEKPEIHMQTPEEEILYQ